MHNIGRKNRVLQYQFRTN